MTRRFSIHAARFGLFFILLLLSACNRQPTDIFLPIVIGEATTRPTVESTILDTPVSTRTPLAVTRTVTSPAQILTPLAPTRTPDGNPIDGTPIAQRGTPSAVGIILPIPVPMSPTATPTSFFRTYLSLIVSQLQRSVSVTATPIPAPIVVTLDAPSTPTPMPTLPPTLPPTPTATSGPPTSTPTPFTGKVRLLERDPVAVDGVIPVVAYADPNNVLEKDWSDFYAQHPTNSNFVRIYTSERSRIYGPAVALTTADQWAEGVCMVPSTLVGVQFWGDENDGWARLLVDGIERWRGNTYGRSPLLFVRFLEVSNLPPAPHVVRVEPLGQSGTTLPGGNSHVSIYAVVCGLPVASEIFVPILQR